MVELKEPRNDAVALKTFDTLYNNGDYAAAELMLQMCLGDHFDCIDP
jgi:hypothetical protein